MNSYLNGSCWEEALIMLILCSCGFFFHWFLERLWEIHQKDTHEKLDHIAEMLEELADQLVLREPVDVSTLLEEAKEIAGRLEKKNLQPLAKKIYQAIQANLGCKIAVSVLAKGEGCLIEDVRQAACNSRQLKYIRDQEHEYIGIKE